MACCSRDICKMKSKNEIVRVEDEIVTLPSLASKIPDSKMFIQGRGSFRWNDQIFHTKYTPFLCSQA